jgi:lipopolysaccharide/colanic/teichoic acid biosynthesis glycosyltransferase
MLKPNALRLALAQPLLTDSTAGARIFSQELFLKLLCLERKRTERSGRRFVLMLLDPGALLAPGRTHALPNLLLAISQATRDTDIVGWHKQGATIGVIFTEIGAAGDKVIVQLLSTKLMDSLYANLSVREVNHIKLSFHLFPENWGHSESGDPVTSILELAFATDASQNNKGQLKVKRLIDIAGSLAALILFLPVMLLIALAIKSTSKGPAVFRQKRLGRYGKGFSFFKFRSMYVDSDSAIHKEYARRFITGARGMEAANGDGLYKLTADPRVTAVGRFLRKTSLDELPQFINVLLGDMSLVGPRPPIPYEFEHYALWHRRRVLAVKPGITGLWQVIGRSRVTFDDMVRLDIRYANSWSLWLDIQILLQTPQAVLSGIGAC